MSRRHKWRQELRRINKYKEKFSRNLLSHSGFPLGEFLNCHPRRPRARYRAGAICWVTRQSPLTSTTGGCLRSHPHFIDETETLVNRPPKVCGTATETEYLRVKRFAHGCGDSFCAPTHSSNFSRKEKSNLPQA